MEENVQTEAPAQAAPDAPDGGIVGNDVPESDASEVEVLREKFEETRTMDDAFEMMQAEQDEASLHDTPPVAHSEDTAPEVEQAPAKPEDEPQYSAADVQTLTGYQIELQKFHEEVAHYQHYMANTDPNSIDQHQARAAEQYLTQKQQALQQIGEGIEAKERGKQLDIEQAKLKKAIPDLDAPALHTYLTRDMGYSDADIENANDHRLFAIAEKARRYDQLMADQNDVKPKRVPKLRKGAPKKAAPVESAELKEARSLAQTRGTPEDAYNYLQAADREKAKSGNQQKRTPRQKVGDAKRRLKKSGREDDALALLRAKKELRAQGAAA